MGLSISYSLKVTLELSLTVRIKRNNPHFFGYIILLYIKTMGILFFLLVLQKWVFEIPFNKNKKLMLFTINVVMQYSYITTAKIITKRKYRLILENKIIYMQMFFHWFLGWKTLFVVFILFLIHLPKPRLDSLSIATVLFFFRANQLYPNCKK